MSISVLLLILAAILFGISTFAPGVGGGRTTPGGLFCLVLSMLLSSGAFGLS